MSDIKVGDVLDGLRDVQRLAGSTSYGEHDYEDIQNAIDLINQLAMQVDDLKELKEDLSRVCESQRYSIKTYKKMIVESSLIPEGFAIVPKKLTEKMLKSFFAADDIAWDDVYIYQVDKLRYQYLCMLEASPKPTDK